MKKDKNYWAKGNALTVRLSQQEREHAETAALHYGISLSEFIRQAVANECKTYDERMEKGRI